MPASSDILNALSYRDFRTDDEDALLALANNANVSRYMVFSFPYPYLREHAHHWVNTGWREHGMINKVICLEGEFVGSVGYARQTFWRDHIAEVGYWLGEPYWGRGIASAALTWMLAELFQNPWCHKILAPVLAPNIASRRVLENCGFELEGILRDEVSKNGSFHDVCYYALRRKR